MAEQENNLNDQMNATADAAQIAATQIPTIDQPPQQMIKVDENTAYQLRLMQYDKEIAEAESKVYELKKQKIQFSFERNMSMVVNQSQQELLKQQIEAETRKRLEEQMPKK